MQGSHRPQVYLAGPDVFYPQARRHGEALCAICAAYGLEGLYPLDAPLESGQALHSEAIYRANRDMIIRSDAVVANLRDWRGPEPDSGTVWEVAYALALGKPVVAYLPESLSYRERFRALAPDGRDQEGNEVEDFGLPLNLMLAHSLTAVVYGPEEGYAGFRAALEALQQVIKI